MSFGYTSQEKVDKTLGDIENVKTYYDAKLFLNKEIFSKHIYHLRVIFTILRDLGLTVNSPKLSFGLDQIT